jgi:hypothetical protein
MLGCIRLVVRESLGSEGEAYGGANLEPAGRESAGRGGGRGREDNQQDKLSGDFESRILDVLGQQNQIFSTPSSKVTRVLIIFLAIFVFSCLSSSLLRLYHPAA